MAESLSRRGFVAGAALLIPAKASLGRLPSILLWSWQESGALADSLAKMAPASDQVTLPDRGGTKWRLAGADKLDPAGRGMWWFPGNDGKVWRIAENPLRPEHLGATGSGDEHPILQQWASLLGDGVQGQIDGSHTLGAQIVFNGRKDFSVGGTGRLAMAGNAPAAKGFSALVFINCSNFEVSGVTVDGNRAARGQAEVPVHNVQFQACHGFKATNVVSQNAPCDGFYIASPTPNDTSSHCSDFTFTGCRAENNARQGLSLIQGHRGTFTGCTFTGTHGISPEAGVDLESNPGNPDASITDVIFDQCHFTGNRGFGFQVYHQAGPDAVTLRNCAFQGNGRGPVEWGARSGTIDRPHFVGSRKADAVKLVGDPARARFKMVRPKFGG